MKNSHLPLIAILALLSACNTPQEQPKNRITIVQEQEGKLLVPQKSSPWTGDPIKKDYYVDILGKRIYGCCKKDLKLIRTNPQKALRLLKEMGEFAVDVPE